MGHCKIRPCPEDTPVNGSDSHDRETMTRKRMLCFVVVVSALTFAMAADSRAGIKAGAAQRDTTPPVGLETRHYYRKSTKMLDSWRTGVFLGLSHGNVGRVYGQKR